MKHRKQCRLLLSAIMICLMVLGNFSGSLAAYAEDEDASLSDYDYIEELLKQDKSISYDPNEQTFLVVDVKAVQSENMKKYDIYKAEDHIKEYDVPFNVSINDKNVGKGAAYYLASKSDNTIEEAVAGSSFKMAANSGEVAVFILDKGDTYQISYEMNNGNYYTDEYWKDESGKQYNGYQFICRPTSGKVNTEYSGTAGDTPIVAPFSFQWDLSNWIDVELFMPDIKSKIMNYPGWVFAEDTTGFVDFKVELRDSEGNITLLPKTFFNNYGTGATDDCYTFMKKDGVISIPVSNYSEDLEKDNYYGEFDFYIPFGYDYRITPLSYSVDTL